MQKETKLLVNYYDSANRLSRSSEELQGLFKFRELIKQLISRSIKTRYKRSVLGVVWTMLNPLLMVVVLTLVFSTLFRFDVPYYPIYLLSGLSVWNFFSSSTQQAMGELIFNSELLKRIYIPKSAFIISAIGTGLVNMVLMLIPLFLIAIIIGAPIKWTVIILPISIIIITLFTLGIGLIMATAAIYFADMKPIYEVLLLVWFYTTPVIFPLSILPVEWKWLFLMNPVYYLIEIFRQPLYGGNIPNIEIWIIALGSSIIVFLSGWFLFTFKSDEYSYRI